MIRKGLSFQLALVCARLTSPVVWESQKAFFSRSSSRQYPKHAQCGAEEDNFVDVDPPMGNTAALEDVAPIGRSASPSKEWSDATSKEVLGVVRTVPEDDGVRYSRFRIPLEADEMADTRPRSNTRAGLLPGEEAAYADTPASINADSSSKKLSTPLATKASDGEAAIGTRVADEGNRLPDPVRLPYDDERFAEMLLEMEVNGVIDEAWQDVNKARLEDVKEIRDILASLKVRDVCCIDVSEKTSNFDYMMFGTCEGARHIHLAAWAVQEADKVHRVSKIKRKQTDELWEVVPVGRIVVNLMVESFREEMTLERKWAVTRSMDPLAGANAPISEGRQVKAHGLWTLTLNLQDLEDFEVDYCKDILMRQM